MMQRVWRGLGVAALVLSLGGVGGRPTAAGSQGAQNR